MILLSRLSRFTPSPSAGFLPSEMVLPPPLDQCAAAPPPSPKFALLINPFYPKDPRASFGKHVLAPSLSLTSIAAVTPADWTVRYWDENLLQGPPPTDPFPSVVGITVHLTFAKRAYQLARYFRNRGAKVILGGLHVASCPDEAEPHADAIAIGDGVQLWPVILKDICEGGLQSVYRADFTAPFRDEPPPKRDLLPKDCFLTTASLIATRGCHNRCGFCYLSTRGVRMPFMARDVDQVAAEFQSHDQPYGVFTDNNLGANPEYLRKLCGRLRPLEKIWSAAVSLDVTDDPSLVADMALAGCTGVFIGFESLTDANLLKARKRTPRAADYARRVAILHENGIQVNGSFVLGFDNDGPGVFQETVGWIEQNRLECATFHILTPYPGTPLFRQMEAEGRLLHRNWELYDTAHVVFRPMRMTADELMEGYSWCYNTLFSSRSRWLRRPRDWAAVPSYMAMAYLYKRSNRLWRFLIMHRLTAKVWRPLVELNRRRHIKYRRKLVKDRQEPAPGVVVAAGM
jgi:radical SAM superfamily enzyme YgiQ (UPF0313 family)